MAWAASRGKIAALLFPAMLALCGSASATDAEKLYSEGYDAFFAQDHDRARQLFQESCDAGYLQACSRVGNYREMDGELEEALDIYKRVCEAGEGDSCKFLGIKYYFGEGVPVDREKARSLFTQGCDRGNADGCAFLGMMYYNGDAGEKDKSIGLHLLKLSCAFGSAKGCKYYEEYCGFFCSLMDKLN